jgi:hypothetical protein
MSCRFFLPQFLLLYLNLFSSPLVTSVLIFPLFPFPVLFLACLLFYSLISRPIYYSISSSDSLFSQPLTEFLSLNYKPHFRIRTSSVLPECMFRLIKTTNTWWVVLLDMGCLSRVLLQTSHKGKWRPKIDHANWKQFAAEHCLLLPFGVACLHRSISFLDCHLRLQREAVNLAWLQINSAQDRPVCVVRRFEKTATKAQRIHSIVTSDVLGLSQSLPE